MTRARTVQLGVLALVLAQIIPSGASAQQADRFATNNANALSGHGVYGGTGRQTRTTNTSCASPVLVRGHEPANWSCPTGSIVAPGRATPPIVQYPTTPGQRSHSSNSLNQRQSDELTRLSRPVTTGLTPEQAHHVRAAQNNRIGGKTDLFNTIRDLTGINVPPVVNGLFNSKLPGH